MVTLDKKIKVKLDGGNIIKSINTKESGVL